MPKESAFKRRLAALRGEWERSAKRDPRSGSEIPDGVYRATITGCELTESMSSGRLQIAWEYTILDGDERGQQVRDYDGVQNEDSLFFIRRKLSVLGYEPDSPEELEETCSQIAGDQPTVRIRVKTNGEFVNVYINKLLEGDEDGIPRKPQLKKKLSKPLPSPKAAPEEPEETEEADEPEEITEEVFDEEPEEEELTLTEDMRVSFKVGRRSCTGTVRDFTPDNSKAIVEDDDTGKKFKIPCDRLEVLEEKETPKDKKVRPLKP